MPEDDLELEENGAEGGEGGAPHALWSGAITFGLLSLPVDLFPASRPRALPLKLVDARHRPLTRRYMCPAHNRFLSRDEIVRGYEVEKDEYVVVTDEELESVAPEKSRAIDLRIFVDVAEIGPLFFKRSYFMTPGQGAARAYRLLAETMERSGRAGLATFVMRGKEYLVALLAEHGILRAETLRFEDEIRRSDDVGLGIAGRASDSRVAAFRREIASLAAKDIDRSELEDSRIERLRELIERKLERGIDVEQAPEAEEEEAGEGEIIDLMEVLKRRLRPEGGASDGESDRGAGTESGRGAGTADGGGRRAKRARPKRESADLERLSKEDLYERAKALRVPGRSKMGKEELIEALRAAEG